MKRTREMFTRAGFEPSNELLAGLEKVTRGGAVTVSLNPREPVAPTDLALFAQQPEYMIQDLGLELLVDGTPIPDLGTAVEQEAEAEAGNDSTQPVDETWKPTPMAELPRHLKRPVRVFTASGQEHEGYMTSIDAKALVLTQELAGGSATFRVARADIDRVLVLRP